MSAAPQFVPDASLSEVFSGLPAFASAGASSGSAAGAMRGLREVTGYAATVRAKVLVVDPDERASSVLLTRLGAEGFDVTVVRTAEEALRTLTPGGALPALVIAEAELSGTDGFAFCAQLRAEERTASLPVMLLGGQGGSSHPEMAGMAAADVFLPKPIFVNDVVALVRLWSGAGAGARRLESHTSELPLPHALRALLSSTRSGRIFFEKLRAQLAFREGRVIDASFEALRGPDAVARILLLAEGPYQVSLGPALARATCSYGLEELCGRLFPRLARWHLLRAHSVPLDAVLAVDFKRLSVELDRLPERINQVVRLFDGRRDVRTALLECPLGEIVALEAINKLYSMGVLEPAEPSDDAPVGGRVLKLKLFEPRPTEAEERMEELFGGAPPPVAEPALSEQTYDWFGDVQNLASADDGLDDPAAGWMARQLNAFQIRPVLEPASPLPADPELEAFSREVAEDEETPAPMGEAYQRMEQDFFDDAPTPAVARRPRPIRWVDRGSLLTFAASFGAVLVVGLSGWGLARWVSRPAAAPAPVPVPAAPIVGVRILPAAPVEAVRAEPAPTLADGMKLYEEGNTADAAVLLARVVDADPTNPQAWLLLGMARFDSGDSVGAQDAATRAAELDPKVGRVHMLLASIFLDQKDRAHANDELNRYLALEPNGEFAAEAKELLRKP